MDSGSKKVALKDRGLFSIARIHEKANRLIVSELRKRGLGNLAPSHGDILVCLLMHKELSMKKLAEFIDRDKSTVTALVQKLNDLGYVDKKTVEGDARVTNVYLTEKGKGVYEDFVEISCILQDRMYSGLTDEERFIFNDLLSKVNYDW